MVSDTKETLVVSQYLLDHRIVRGPLVLMLSTRICVKREEWQCVNSFGPVTKVEVHKRYGTRLRSNYDDP